MPYKRAEEMRPGPAWWLVLLWCGAKTDSEVHFQIDELSINGAKVDDAQVKAMLGARIDTDALRRLPASSRSAVTGELELKLDGPQLASMLQRSGQKFELSLDGAQVGAMLSGHAESDRPALRLVRAEADDEDEEDEERNSDSVLAEAAMRHGLRDHQTIIAAGQLRELVSSATPMLTSLFAKFSQQARFGLCCRATGSMPTRASAAFCAKKPSVRRNADCARDVESEDRSVAVAHRGASATAARACRLRRLGGAWLRTLHERAPSRHSLPRCRGAWQGR